MKDLLVADGSFRNKARPFAGACKAPASTDWTDPHLIRTSGDADWSGCVFKTPRTIGERHFGCAITSKDNTGAALDGEIEPPVVVDASLPQILRSVVLFGVE